MKKHGYFLALFAAGMLVFFVGGYWAGISHPARSVIKTILPLVLLAFTITCHRSEGLRPWRGASLALLAASCGFLVSWWLSGPLLRVLDVTPDSVSGIALTKLTDALLIVLPVLLVARLGGCSPADLYLRKGKPKAWLTVGLVTFTVFLVLFLLQATDQGYSTAQLLSLAPWTLVFIFSNAFMEELHFRGLLLDPFADLLGRHGANLCIALFFTLVHAPVQYTSDIWVFLAILFFLALAWGYVIQRTDALWGSVLFHAGADLLIVLGIYETYGKA